MDAVHLHLILNHFPIVGTLIGVALLLGGILLRKKEMCQSAYLIIGAMALAAIPVMLTGEPAEEAVESLAGISETLIEDHEHAAELAFWIMEALGILSLGALFSEVFNIALAPVLRWLTLILGFVAFGAMARTGYLGGQIRHSEIRGGASVSTTTPIEAGGEQEEKD